MGLKNEHEAFRITSLKETKKHITPSIEMPGGKLVTYHNILEHHKVSWVANMPDVFPEDPEENEITYKDGQLWIYKKIDALLQWIPMAGGGPGSSVPATTVIEDPSHRFVTEEQLNVIQEVADGLIPAPKIVQDGDHQFLDQTQVDVVNDLIEGVEIDGGDLT